MVLDLKQRKADLSQIVSGFKVYVSRFKPIRNLKIRTNQKNNITEELIKKIKNDNVSWNNYYFFSFFKKLKLFSPGKIKTTKNN